MNHFDSESGSGKVLITMVDSASNAMELANQIACWIMDHCCEKWLRFSLRVGLYGWKGAREGKTSCGTGWCKMKLI
jgi:hypothetical protein